MIFIITDYTYIISKSYESFEDLLFYLLNI